MLDGIGIKLPFSVTGYSMVVVIIGAFAPMMAAITLVAREAGWKGTKAFLGQALDFHFKPIYLVIALALPVLIHAIAHYLAPAVGLDVAKTSISDRNICRPDCFGDSILYSHVDNWRWTRRIWMAGLCSGTFTKKNRGHTGKFSYWCNLGYLAFTLMVYGG